MPPDKNHTITAALRLARAGNANLLRMKPHEMAEAFQKTNFWNDDIGNSNSPSRMLTERSSFLMRLPVSDQAIVLENLTDSVECSKLLNTLAPIERMNLCEELGNRVAESLKSKYLIADKSEIVTKLPGAVIPTTLQALEEKDARKVLAFISKDDLLRVMKRVAKEACSADASYIIRMLEPRVANVLINDFPIAFRVGLLLPLSRAMRERILKAFMEEGSLEDISQKSHSGPKIVDSRIESTIKAVLEARQQSMAWEEADPSEVSREIQSRRQPTLLTAAILSLIPVGDLASILEVLAQSAGIELQALYLSRLPKSLRSGLSVRLGFKLVHGVARNAAAMAQSMIPYSRTIVAASLSSL